MKKTTIPPRKLKQWRTETPANHKSFGEKRGRDWKKINEE